MEILIKGMVCHHCVEAVERVLRSAGLTPVSVTLGRAEVKQQLDGPATMMLDRLLENEGFTRILDADSLLVEKIKRAVIEHVRQPAKPFGMSRTAYRCDIRHHEQGVLGS